jgi:hypothetical protein
VTTLMREKLKQAGVTVKAGPSRIQKKLMRLGWIDAEGKSLGWNYWRKHAESLMLHSYRKTEVRAKSKLDTSRSCAA